MAEDLIRYDILAQEALRGVVRKVLSEVGRTGLPGEHHFFISFVTRAPGVKLSQRLLDQYDKEMTIVLQNQYWDLKVTDSGFEVGLSFDGQPEILGIPFSAIKGFFDPSVQFGLQFDVGAPGGKPSALPTSEPQQLAQDTKATPPTTAEVVPESTETPAAPGEKVVSLDSFRKKP